MMIGVGLKMILFPIGLTGGGSTPVTLDPAQKTASITLSNGNLTATNTTTNHAFVLGTTSKSSGKWYFEVTNTGGASGAGIASSLPSEASYKASGLYLMFSPDSYIAQSLTAEGNASPTANWASGRVGVAIDLDNNRIAWYNGTNWANSANTGTGSGMTTLSAGTYFPCVYAGNNASTSVSNAIFSSFTYAIPSGFSAWS